MAADANQGIAPEMAGPMAIANNVPPVPTLLTGLNPDDTGTTPQSVSLDSTQTANAASDPDLTTLQNSNPDSPDMAGPIAVANSVPPVPTLLTGQDPDNSGGSPQSPSVLSSEDSVSTQMASNDNDPDLTALQNSDPDMPQMAAPIAVANDVPAVPTLLTGDDLDVA